MRGYKFSIYDLDSQGAIAENPLSPNPSGASSPDTGEPQTVGKCLAEFLPEAKKIR